MNLRAFARTNPATLGLIVVALLSFVLGWAGVNTVELALIPTGSILGVLTYPLVEPTGMVLFLILGVLWMYMFCASVESQEGAGRFLGLYFGFALLGGLLMRLAWALGHLDMLAGFHYPVSAMVMIWAARNQMTAINFWGIPINGKILGIINAAFVLFSHKPVPGLLLVGGLILPWFYALGTFKFKKKEAPSKFAWEDDDFRSRVKDREKEREERERLRKLFESSLNDDASNDR